MLHGRSLHEGFHGLNLPGGSYRLPVTTSCCSCRKTTPSVTKNTPTEVINETRLQSQPRQVNKTPTVSYIINHCYAANSGPKSRLKVTSSDGTRKCPDHRTIPATPDLHWPAAAAAAAAAHLTY